VLVLLRERAWWLPAWLDRSLPNMDVEGANLEHRVASREAAMAENGDAPMMAVTTEPRGQE
jgi:putative drug exporter of the RND superfamily